MHLALASDPDDPAFAPEPLTGAELAALTDRLNEQVRISLSALRDQADPPRRPPADGRRPPGGRVPGSSN